MTEETHTVDCGLRAVDQPPTRCTCGFSRPFKVWEYRAQFDEFGWAEHSRESLVATTMSGRLAFLYGGDNPQLRPLRVRRSVLIRRAIQDHFIDSEHEVMRSGWESLWLTLTDAWKERMGLDDFVRDIDGSPLEPLFRKALEEYPSDDEVRAALAWWVPYWSTLENT